MSNNQKTSTNDIATEKTREAYGGRLRQGILPFLFNEYVFSPFAMLKHHPTHADAGHHEDDSLQSLPPWRPPTLRSPKESSNFGADSVVPPRPIETNVPVKRGPGRPRKVPIENGPVVKVKETPKAVILQPVTQPVKRGPGRPRKILTYTETHTVNLERTMPSTRQPVVEAPSPIKRKRGRPPKVLFIAHGGDSPRVKRGRPPLIKADEAKPEVPVRRGPGRPPRNLSLIDEGVITRPPIQHKNRPTSPFTIRVEGLANDTDRKSVVEIFKKWFPKIKKSLFKEFVQPHQGQCTKRRQSFTGPFHWLIRDTETNMVLCAASGMIHSRQFCNSFMEILYFATVASHLSFGLGRLLNAALQKFAYNANCEYVLVQASREAVPFWTKPGVGYSSISRDLMAKFKHFYEMRSIQLSDTVLLSWTVDEPSQRVADSIHRLSKQVRLDGDI
ncbi:AT hook-like protein [Perkinsela sp. CCAP 1560/4]|nr:AT hook-like protein [Perkinsela sp. CCAP 1560/4]|eukprot:KNH06674.1 AT hook-like protein [Perkinsela sp. CCAP 1560/4]